MALEKCLECGEEFEGKTRLSLHCFRVHNLTVEDYTVKFFYNGERPKCPVCGENTSYERGAHKFKKFCPKHKKEAQSSWSKENGFGTKVDAGWKKGLTKHDHPGIMAHSLKMKGEGNPFYGINFIKETGREEEIRQLVADNTRRTEKEYIEAFDLLGNFTPVTPYSEYKNQTQELDVKCNNCGKEQKSNLFAILNYAVCRDCWTHPKHTQETKTHLKNLFITSQEDFQEIINNRKDDFEVLTSYEQYKEEGRKKDYYLDVKCNKCNRVLKRTLRRLEAGTLCQYCYSPSKDEKELSDFVESLGLEIIKNNREVLSPYEVDVFIPSLGVAIEYNGLFWHAEQYKSNRYHHEKYLLAKQNDIKLIQIFSDEWINKKDIVKSILCSKLGATKESVYARECEVFESDLETKSRVIKFFEENHIDGNTNFIKSFYLSDATGEIVSALSLRSPFHSKEIKTIEIARFATKKNLQVPGGFSRLLKRAKEWARQEGYKKIITYSDFRFGDGLVYENNGFALESTIPINYWYTDFRKRYNRFKFRAQNGKSEKTVAEESGVVKVFGAGNKLYGLLI